MLITVETEIFHSPARVLVNPVNTAGVMSSGVSAEFKRFFPDAFSRYRSLCEAGQIEPGRLFFYRADFRTVLHLPIKRHWRTTSTAEIVETGLQKLAAIWADQGIHTLAIPRFAEGELDWDTVIRPMLEIYLAPLPIPVYLHHQSMPDTRRSIRQIDQSLNQPSQYLPFNRIWKDLGRIVRRTYGQFTTEDHRSYTVAFQDGARYSRLVITPDGETSVSVGAPSLTELWDMLQSARMLLPSQFPSGLEAIAPYLIPLLAKTDYMRVVRAAMGDATPSAALLLTPPPDTQPRKLKFLSEEPA
jgi:O-acetyl-ADP-ribose deacetylase (regulator of RNase III)